MRVSEVYLSIQGEGPNAGVPTIFVRFGGCNLRCALWPCDTPWAVDPKIYRNEWRRMTPEELLEETLQFWYPGVNVCLTGGEPMLQPVGELEQYLKLLKERSIKTEMFSNGTVEYNYDVVNRIDTIVLDWKLPGSGENWKDEVRIRNIKRLASGDAVKFTIAGEEDYEIAKAIQQKYLLAGSVRHSFVCAGVVWDKLTNEELVQWMLDDKLNWRLTVQVHNHIWDRTKRGI